MVIQDRTGESKNTNQGVWKWIFLTLPVILLLLFLTKKSSESPGVRQVWLCDMENAENEFFISAKDTFAGGKTRSDEQALSGKFSSKISQGTGMQYGVAKDFKDFLPGTTYRVTIWRYQPVASDDGTLVVAANDGKAFYQSTNIPIEVNQNYWKKLQLAFTVPLDQSWHKINIHTFASGQQPVYFDDFKIEKIEPEYEHFRPQKLQIKLEEKAFEKLQQKRKEAREKGILESGDDDWVKGSLAVDSLNAVPIKLRLKGDWLDHLENDKWSFRVEVKDPHAVERMISFSLHTPAARYFLHEWLFHQMLESEDILTTRYDFVELTLNEKPLGIYAMEEHFEKQLVEYKNRREGPILKFSEDGFWSNISRQYGALGYFSHDQDHPVRHSENAPAEPFNPATYEKDSALDSVLRQALILQEQYHQNALKNSEVFDIERLAKYYAICDALGAYHGIVWHNQRFYYNPIISKLEPIGFDGFSGDPGRRYHFLGQGATNPFKIDSGTLTDKVFLDPDFTEKYIAWFYHFSSPSFLKSFFEKINPGLQGRAEFLKKEFPDYQLDENRILESAQFVRTLILPFPQSLRAFSETRKNDSVVLKIANYHHLPLQIVGTGSSSKNMTQSFAMPVLLPARPSVEFWNKMMHPESAGTPVNLDDLRHLALNSYLKQEQISYQKLSINSHSKFLFFKVLGVDSLFAAPIYFWSPPQAFTDKQMLFKDVILNSNSIFRVEGKRVIFKKGQHRSERDILIPKDKEVVFEAGVEIDFLKGAKFISYSPLAMLGAEDNPIKISSSDGSARGFTVFQTKLPSKLSYVTFSGFNTLIEGGWKLTGAVNFYEAEVNLYRCVFGNNHCEDALNIIRSNFLMEKCLVINTPFDGFDCDFCIGEIKNSVFENTKNDGMDFSGSVINIWNSKTYKNGDKGLSVGEDSEVNVFGLEVSNAVIGVASKDLSTLVIENIKMDNCDFGFAAYQKKPEFGPAHILVKNYETKFVKRLYQIGPDCKLQMDGKFVK